MSERVNIISYKSSIANNRKVGNLIIPAIKLTSRWEIHVKHKKMISCIIIILLIIVPYLSMQFPSDAVAPELTTTITGSDKNNLFGWNISSAGDVNGDGYDDMIVGAPGNNSNRGAAHIFFGSPWLTGDLSSVNANVTINGSWPGDMFGWDVSGAGDVNKDGYNDTIVGAPGNSSNTGSTYIFYGNSFLPKYQLSTDANVTLLGGATGNGFGSSVSNAGDVNNDGYGDVIVGSPKNNYDTGSAYIFYGNESSGINVNAGDANVTLFGDDPGDFYGFSVSDAGNVNNDAYDDVIIGAPGTDQAYIYFGSDSMENDFISENITIFSDGFESGDFTNWTYVDNPGSGGEWAVITTPDFAGNAREPHSGTYSATCRDTDDVSSYLLKTGIDLRDYWDIKMSFWYHEEDLEGDEFLYLDIFHDGAWDSNLWTSAGGNNGEFSTTQGLYENYNINISALLSTPYQFIGFRFNAHINWDWLGGDNSMDECALDDIRIYGNTTSPANITINGAPGTNFGRSVSELSDFNGNGYDDVIVGAPSIQEWWNDSWNYRMKLIFDNSGQSESLLNFPVLVNLNSMNFDYSKANPNGSDLRFIDTDHSTELKYHIEEWNTSGNSYIWVNVTNIARNSSSDHIWLYYNNSLASNVQDIAGTYDHNDVGVWHLNETSKTPGTYNDYLDSTSYGNDGEAMNGVDMNTAGRIDGAGGFDGTDDYIEIPDSDLWDFAGKKITVDLWFKAIDTQAEEWPRFIDHFTGGAIQYGWYFGFVQGADNIVFAHADDNTGDNIDLESTNTYNDNQWHHVAATLNGSTAKLYIDGKLDQTDSYSNLNDRDETFKIGGQDLSNNLNGIIDEVRVSNTTRSADWVAAQYLSMTNTFITYSGEETKCWWDDAWGYRKQLYFDNSGQSETLSNFPVLVNLSSWNFDYSKAKSDGTDLRFIDNDDVTELKYHIEEWNTSGYSYIWVNVSKIQGGSSTDYIWMYYNNSAAPDVQNVSGTYNKNYTGVWHLNETTGSPLLDSTINNNDGLKAWDAELNTSGKIDGAYDFDGDGDNILVDDFPSITGEMTISAWLYADSQPGGWRNYLVKWADGADSPHAGNAYYVALETSGAGHYVKFRMEDGSGATNTVGNTILSLNEWHHVVAVYNGSHMLIYVNGNLDNTPAARATGARAVGTRLNIGNKEANPSYGHSGTIDEVRISNTTRSADWIKAQYLSMNNSFIIYGDEKVNIRNENGSVFIIDGAFLSAEAAGDWYIDLASCDSANVTLTGAAKGDQFGFSVSDAGDLDNDGLSDIIIGAPYNGTNSEGMVYLFYSNNLTKYTPATYADGNWSGENAGDYFGFSVSKTGEKQKNTRGVGLAVSAPYFDEGANLDIGKVYLYFKPLVADYIKYISGDDQEWDVDQYLLAPVVFKVLNASGYVVPGAKVNFTFENVPLGASNYYFKETGNTFYQAISDNFGLVSTTIHLGTETGNYIINVSGDKFTGKGGFIYNNTINATAVTGQLSYISLIPNYAYPSAYNVYPGGIINVYNAKGYDKFGNLNLTWTTPTWGNTNPAMGTPVGTSGDPVSGYTASYTAGPVPGFDNITVQSGSISNSSCINIQARALAYISLTPLNTYPTSRSVIAGKTVLGYRALGYDQYSNKNTSWSPVWDTSNGLGTSNPLGGNALTGYLASYTSSGTKGYDNITVKDLTNGPISNMSCIKIIPDKLNYISLTPLNTYPSCTQVMAGKITTNFSAKAYDKFGNLNTSWTPTWSTSSGIGTVIPQGGDAKSGFEVKYQSMGILGYDNITVNDNVLTTIGNRSCIEVIPGKVFNIEIVGGNGQTGVVGDTLSNPLIVRVIDDYSNPVKAGINVYFNISTSGLNGDGIFTGSGTSTFVVKTNSYGRASAQLQLDTKVGVNTVSVEIVPGISVSFQEIGIADALFTLEIDPQNAEMTINSQVKFNLNGLDKFGNSVLLTGTIWETNAGTLTNKTENSCILVAKITPLSDGYLRATVGSQTVSSSVVIKPGNLFKIEIIPDLVILTPGKSQQFFATGTDIFNNSVELESTSWFTDSGTIASFTNSTAEFVAQEKIKTNGYIMAVSNGIMGLATVNIELMDNAPVITGFVPDIIMNEDDPPYVVYLGSYEMDFEDYSVDLDWYFEDKAEELYWMSGERSDNDIIVITPKPNKFGDDNVTLILEDSSGAIDTQSMWINITPINDKPSISGCPDAIVHYDVPYSFNFAPYIYDIESKDDELILTISDNSGGVYYSIDGLNVTFNYPEKLLGRDIFVILNISDTEDHNSDIITIKVTDDYVPTLIQKLPNVILYEGETKLNVFDLDDYFEDPDKDSLFYTFGETHVVVTINDDNTVDISSPEEWNGEDTITFRAKDPIGAIAEDTILVMVIPINDPPTIKGVPDVFYVHYDSDYIFDLTPYISDKDNETKDLFLILEDTHIRIDPVNHLKIIMYYPYDMIGIDILVALVVSDGIDQGSQMVTVKVTHNWPPELVKELPNVLFYEDEFLINAFILDNYFIDIDSEKFYYSYGQEFINVTINPDNSVDFKTEPNWYGMELVTFRATDLSNAFAETVVVVSVIPVNDAPVIETLPEIHGIAKDQLKFDLTNYISDIDNDVTDLTINVTSENLDITVSGMELIIYHTRSIEEEITITVSDGIDDVSRNILIKIKAKKIDSAESNEFLMSIVWLLIMVIVIIFAITGYAGYRRYKGNYTVEEIFWIYKDSGLLLSHVSANVSKHTGDVDMVSGMLTGVLDFTRDAFAEAEDNKESWSIKEIKMGDKTILIDRGKYTFLATLFSGWSGKKLYKQSNQVMETLEKNYYAVLNNWGGNLGLLKPSKEVICTLLPPPDVKNKKQIISPPQQPPLI